MPHTKLPRDVMGCERSSLNPKPSPTAPAYNLLAQSGCPDACFAGNEGWVFLVVLSIQPPKNQLHIVHCGTGLAGTTLRHLSDSLHHSFGEQGAKMFLPRSNCCSKIPSNTLSFFSRLMIVIDQIPNMHDALPGPHGFQESKPGRWRFLSI